MREFIDSSNREWILSFLEGLDCPRSLLVAILVREQDVVGLASLEVDPHHYLSAHAYQGAALATGLFRKINWCASTLAHKQRIATVEKWLRSERMCFLTNRSFEKRGFTPEYLDTVDPKTSCEDSRVLSAIRAAVRTIIGDVVPPIHGIFGPGATVSDRDGNTTVLHKLSSKPTLTPELTSSQLLAWIASGWGRLRMPCHTSPFRRIRRNGVIVQHVSLAGMPRINIEHHVLTLEEDLTLLRGDFDNTPQHVSGNLFFVVPKNVEINRACAMEPSVNGFLQLGTGSVLKQLIRKNLGYAIEKMEPVHGELARIGSLDDDPMNWATLDMSMASDTVATGLVNLVAPAAWREHFNGLRSPFTVFPGDKSVASRQVFLEKHSSMGNGYTWELESIIFLSICMASGLVPGKTCYVYGDDIIVPRWACSRVIRALQLCGFCLNTEKSFTSGPFRESCGWDYFEGHDVRPYFLESLPSEPQEYIRTANGIYELMRHCEPRRAALLRRAWFKVQDLLPLSLRQCRGPQSFGDLVIHDEEKYWSYRERASVRYLRVYKPLKRQLPAKNRFSRFSAGVIWAGALYGVSPYPPQPLSLHPPKFEGVLGKLGKAEVLGFRLGWVPFS